MGIEEMSRFLRLVGAVSSADDLADAMREICAVLDVEYFALTHHVDVAQSPGAPIRVHNYPSQWADFYERQAFAVSDPVHRASHVTSLGFRWSDMARMIPLTAGDRRMLMLGREQGIDDGFTVPANVPGEAHGSCTFVSSAGRALCATKLPMAQLAGAFAFESARRLWSGRGDLRSHPAPSLTDRQRECVMWAARGKSDWEISRILAISEETVTRHLKLARERYGVPKRALLAIRTIYDGTLSFDDVLI